MWREGEVNHKMKLAAKTINNHMENENKNDNI
jgi:hypothetical protein